MKCFDFDEVLLLMINFVFNINLLIIIKVFCMSNEIYMFFTFMFRKKNHLLCFLYKAVLFLFMYFIVLHFPLFFCSLFFLWHILHLTLIYNFGTFINDYTFFIRYVGEQYFFELYSTSYFMVILVYLLWLNIIIIV